jgi:uncharacterized protein YkwD
LLVILVIAVTWLFLLVLAVAILRTAAQAERAAKRRLSEPSPRSPASEAGHRASEAGRRTATTALVVVALPFAGGAMAPDSASAQSCAKARKSAPGQTLCLINQERRVRGLAPLAGNARLGRAANRHAADMVRRGYFSHVSPEGASFFDRLRRAGYARGCASWAGGETLAWGTGSQSSPVSRVAAWMHSPPHRAILLGRFREAGIAVLKGAPGTGRSGFTYVGEFGRRRC